MLFLKEFAKIVNNFYNFLFLDSKQCYIFVNVKTHTNFSTQL